MEIRLSTLGTTAVTKDGEELTSLPGKPVTFGLLVYLALERSVTRDKAATVFWPDSDTNRARANLSQTLHELTKELGDDWLDRRGNLLLTRDPLWVDTQAFETHLDEGRHEEAVGVYNGPFLDGAFLAQTHPFEEWVEHRKGHYRRRHREALESYIRDCRKAGALEKAVSSASNWVAMDPMCEAAQHYLIRVLGESGNRDEAIAQYDRYAASLFAELGLEPLDETKDLIKGIRSPDYKPVVWEKPELEVRSLGWPTALGGGFNGNAVEARIRDRAKFRKMVERELAPDLQVLRPIGRGSMADVFLARDTGLRCLVAVKFLSSELYDDEEARARFQREAQAMARLGLHPNVCDVKQASRLEDRTPYLVMPFIKGTTLAQRLKAEGRLAPGEVRIVLLEMASALAAAHGAGIVHRDVRPDNILREEETGRNILSDFGIAGVLETGDDAGPKLTRTGEFLGNPAYISPEQLESQPLTEKSDIYSLGVVGHELLTGHTPPAEETSERRGQNRVISSLREYPAISALREYAKGWHPIDRRLVDLIGRCLAKNPPHRPTAADIEDRLKVDERELKAEREKGDMAGNKSPWTQVWEKRLLPILGGYVAGSWMVVEIAQYLREWFGWPMLVESLVLVSLVFGFFAASLLGWFHGKKGHQTMIKPEKWLLGMVGVGWLGSLVWIFLTSS